MTPDELEMKRLFVTRLSRLRKAAGLYQKELADRVGVERSTIASWESTSSPYLPEAKHIVRLAEVLGCTVDELLDRPSKAKLEEAKLKQQWPNLTPDRREKAAQIVKMPSVDGYFPPDITNEDFDVMWATLQTAIQAGLTIIEAYRRAVGSSGGHQN